MSFLSIYDELHDISFKYVKNKAINQVIKSYFYHYSSIIDWSDHYYCQNITSTILDRISSVDNLCRRDWNHSFGFFFSFYNLSWKISSVILRNLTMKKSIILNGTISFDDSEDISYCDLWKYIIIYRTNHKRILIYFVFLSWLRNYVMKTLYYFHIFQNLFMMKRKYQ